MSIFCCEHCGFKDDFCNVFMYNDLQLCVKCHGKMHANKKKNFRNSQKSDEFFEKDIELSVSKKGKKK